jgi:hypothetical protein
LLILALVDFIQQFLELGRIFIGRKKFEDLISALHLSVLVKRINCQLHKLFFFNQLVINVTKLISRIAANFVSSPGWTLVPLSNILNKARSILKELGNFSCF